MNLIYSSSALIHEYIEHIFSFATKKNRAISNGLDGRKAHGAHSIGFTP